MLGLLTLIADGPDSVPGRGTEIPKVARHGQKEKKKEKAAVPANKLTLDNLAEGFQLIKIVFGFFYNGDPSMI